MSENAAQNYTYVKNENAKLPPADLPVVNLIMDDQFEGFSVLDFTDTVYEGSHRGRSARIIQNVIKSKPDRFCVEFLFLLDEPMRFRLDVLVPSNCTNARVSLQDQELIGYFSSNIPEDPDPVITAKCGQKNKVSTLHPGEFQSINFRWESGDKLKFFFYFGEYANA